MYYIYLYRFYILGLAFLIFISCAQDQEGCLDIEAANLDITADKACTSCCTYPNLNLSFNHKIALENDTVNFQLGQGYTNDVFDTFAIQNIQFYLSNVSLIRGDGTKIGVIDTMSFYVQNQSMPEQLIDDFQLVNRNTFTYNIGSLKTSGDFIGIEFLVGLDESANNIIPDSITSDHVLAIQTETMYDEPNQSYIFNTFEIIPDTSQQDLTKTYNLNTASLVELSKDFTMSKGGNLTLQFQIDYLSFFKGINFDLDDETTIINKVLNNTQQAFSFTE